MYMIYSLSLVASRLRFSFHADFTRLASLCISMFLGR